VTSGERIRFIFIHVRVVRTGRVEKSVAPAKALTAHLSLCDVSEAGLGRNNSLKLCLFAGLGLAVGKLAREGWIASGVDYGSC